MSARASIALAGAAVRRTSTWHRGAGEDSTCEVAHTSEATTRRAMASADSAYDSNMAASGSGQEAARNAVYVLVQVVSPQGEKHPLKVRPSDDVATLRALCTQVSSGHLVRTATHLASTSRQAVANRVFCIDRPPPLPPVNHGSKCLREYECLRIKNFLACIACFPFRGGVRLYSFADVRHAGLDDGSGQERRPTRVLRHSR